MPDALEQTYANGTATATASETAAQMYARLYPDGPPAGVKPQPIVATLPPEFAQTFDSLKTELAALKDAMAKANTIEKKEQVAEWVEKIRTGDFDGAEQVMLDRTLAKLAPKLEEIKKQAYQDAVNASTTNLEIDRHVQKLKLENPDIVQFERYLTAPVNQRVEEARAAGKIKTHADYVRETKTALDAEVTELRNQILVLRGQGKTEAQTRNQQVLSSTTLTPNQVQSTNQIADQSNQTEPDVSVESYMERRRADEARRRGLTVG